MRDERYRHVVFWFISLSLVAAMCIGGIFVALAMIERYLGLGAAAVGTCLVLGGLLWLLWKLGI